MLTVDEFECCTAFADIRTKCIKVAEVAEVGDMRRAGRFASTLQKCLSDLIVPDTGAFSC